MDDCKTRGSQIPAFGNWEYVNDLPITQYFECARQAGLIRYSSSSGECCDHHQHQHQHHHHHQTHNSAASPDLYTVDFIKPRTTAPRPKQGKGRERRTGNTHVKEGNRKQAGKVFDVTVTELPHESQATVKRYPPTAVTAVNKKQQQFQYDAPSAAQPRRAPKAVDEDLYKIPPELLKRKKRLGFFSRCLVPPCAV